MINKIILSIGIKLSFFFHFIVFAIVNQDVNVFKIIKSFIIISFDYLLFKLVYWFNYLGNVTNLSLIDCYYFTNYN